jgi:hypothetical protein
VRDRSWRCPVRYIVDQGAGGSGSRAAPEYDVAKPAVDARGSQEKAGVVLEVRIGSHGQGQRVQRLRVLLDRTTESGCLA